MIKLIFYVDFDKDLEIYRKWNLRKFFGEKGFNYFLRESYPKLVGKTDEEIITYFKENRKLIIEQTKNAETKLRRKWEKTNGEFFKEVERVTGFKWKHKVYRCHLSSTFICGGCYDAKKGNVVSVFPKLKEELLLDTLFHELVHLHFWDMMDKLKIKYNPDEKLTAKGEIWDLSEMAVNYPLQKIKIKGHKPELNIYPQHQEKWNRIKEYLNLDFGEFILKSLEVVRWHPPKPCRR